MDGVLHLVYRPHDGLTSLATEVPGAQFNFDVLHSCRDEQAVSVGFDRRGSCVAGQEQKAEQS